MTLVKLSVAEMLKQGLLQSRYYSLALARTRFPGVAVLCYHGVRDDAMPAGTIPFQYLHVPLSTFESHCRLIRESCDPISLDDWRAAIAGRSTLPDRPVLITFDDGYRSVLTLAAPVLASYRLPAAVFVCTGPMASRRMLWFDAVAARESEHAVERWKSRSYDAWSAACAETTEPAHGDPRALLTPSELAALSTMDRIEIGGHTVRHPILSQASPADQAAEIEPNLRAIHEWTGKPVRAFAYPNGRPGVDYTSETTAMLRAAGVDMAFTTRPSFATASEAPLERSRFMMLDEISDAELAHRLAYSWPR